MGVDERHPTTCSSTMIQGCRRPNPRFFRGPGCNLTKRESVQEARKPRLRGGCVARVLSKERKGGPPR